MCADLDESGNLVNMTIEQARENSNNLKSLMKR